jgi:hypothetical protein
VTPTGLSASNFGTGWHTFTSNTVPAFAVLGD